MTEPEIAYFSMEIAVDPAMPTYSGGLGILAGDMLRSAADREVPMAAVTLLYRKGYFRQTLDASGRQSESPESWNPAEKLQLLTVTAQITLEDRPVHMRAWRYVVRGISGHGIPIYFLDTNLSENDAYARSLTDALYAGDPRYRLCQEAVLSQGGLGILEALGHRALRIYHMNEGHSALLGLCLLERQLRLAGRTAVTADDIQTVRRSCVFTTHTPVPAGHDQFSKELARQVLGEKCVNAIEAAEGYHDGTLNMTYLALRFSHYINGVAMHHGEISRGMFPDYPVRAITNGVHAVTWSSPSFRELYDRHVPEWREDNLYLRYAIGIPIEEIRAAHLAAKRKLLEEIRSRTGRALDEKVMTIGFARRAAAYKRLELFFSDCERLKWISKQVGPFQVVCGGKAHPQDEAGKQSIQRVFAAAAELADSVPVVYVENYDMAWASLLVSGVDLWLNTPLPPEESSGTSGMKAALNGIPSFSVLDGWWIEGHVEGFTGWTIEDGIGGEPAAELASLYGKFARVIVPMYYGRPDDYLAVMRYTIALNASFFNTQRMISQYVANAYGGGATLTPNLP
ncbi:MAG TPA: alpha-glucan family phosphorylase [Bryobacteraceae bacterium]|nr:alpha-glucan family phosphorylase [Bryobacteraceae bacterium]